jgi:hypothetical protein
MKTLRKFLAIMFMFILSLMLSCGGGDGKASSSVTATPSIEGTHTVVITGTDAAGNPLAGYNSTIIVDYTPPTVSSTSPANGATGVAVNSAITATFSEPVAGIITAFTIDGVTGTISVNDKTYTFTPSTNLAYASTYTAVITNNIVDAAGNAMAANYTWTFTTEAAPDTTPTTVSSTVSVNAATGKAL